MIDGKLLLLTNSPDLSSKEILTHYKLLAGIERGFRVLKSEIEIGLVIQILPLLLTLLKIGKIKFVAPEVIEGLRIASSSFYAELEEVTINRLLSRCGS